MKHIEILDTSVETFYVHFPFHPYVEHNDHPYDWLLDAQGKGFSLGGDGVYFYCERDAIMFTLRWS